MPSSPFWLVNGRVIAEDQVRISPWDRGFRFGDGLYETLRLHQGGLVRLAEHIERMREGLRILDLDLDPALAFPDAALAELVHESGLEGGEGRVRLWVTRGVDRGTARPPETPVPTCLAAIEPLPPDTPLSDPRPLRLAQIEITAPRPAAWAALKSLNHLPYVLAARAAARVGADEALLVYRGQVLETTAANLFLVTGDGIATPPRTAGVLAGVTRDWILDLARAAGLSASEESIPIEALSHARELFVSGSVSGIRAVAAIDGCPVGDRGASVPGPVTRQIQLAYAAAVAAAAGASVRPDGPSSRR